MCVIEDNWIGISVVCPYCHEWLDIESPDRPYMGGKAEAWCVVCGKRIIIEV